MCSLVARPLPCSVQKRVWCIRSEFLIVLIQQLYANCATESDNHVIRFVPILDYGTSWQFIDGLCHMIFSNPAI